MSSLFVNCCLTLLVISKWLFRLMALLISWWKPRVWVKMCWLGFMAMEHLHLLIGKVSWWLCLLWNSWNLHRLCIVASRMALCMAFWRGACCNRVSCQASTRKYVSLWLFGTRMLMFLSWLISSYTRSSWKVRPLNVNCGLLWNNGWLNSTLTWRLINSL